MEKELIKILRKLANFGIKIEKSEDAKWQFIDESRVIAIGSKKNQWIINFRIQNPYIPISKKKFKKNAIKVQYTRPYYLFLDKTYIGVDSGYMDIALKCFKFRKMIEFPKNETPILISSKSNQYIIAIAPRVDC